MLTDPEEQLRRASAETNLARVDRDAAARDLERARVRLGRAESALAAARAAQDAAVLMTTPAVAERSWLAGVLAEGLVARPFLLLTRGATYRGWVAVPPLDRKLVPPYLWTRSTADDWRSVLPEGSRTYFPSLEDPC